MNNCSVVIVAKNGGKQLFATIESILQQKQLSELIIADNGNSPEIITRLQQRALNNPLLKIVSVTNERNFAKACNEGARQASSQYLVIFKSDYLLSPDGLGEMVNVLMNEKHAMLATGIVKEYDGKTKNLPRNQVLTPKSVFRDIISFGFDQYSGRMNVEAKDKPFEVATIPSACICIRASDFKKLGGLDGDFYPQDEELDLSLRVQQIGGRVLCVPTVKITHLYSDNNNKISISKILAEAKNTLRYLNKFFSGQYIFGTLLMLNLLIMLQCILKMMVLGIIEFFQDSTKRQNSVKAKNLMILAYGLVSSGNNESLMGKVVLITGATSQIGLCVIRRLISSGASVLAISRDDEIPYYHSNLRWIKGDMSDPDFSLKGYCVDMVVHCAPLWHLPNIIDILHHAEAKRIIAFSSTALFASLLTAGNHEKELVLQLQNAENVVADKCKELNMDYTIFRSDSIYGVGLDKGITILANIIRRFGIALVYPPAIGRRQPVHADDLAVAVVQALNNENSYNKSYNLSGAEALTLREMMERIFSLYKKQVNIISTTALPFILEIAGKISRNKHINGEIARRMNDDMVFFHDDATKDFGYKPRKFLSGGLKDIEGF